MPKHKKIAMYSPYLDIYGGGERYFFQIASILSTKYKVTVLTSSDVKEKADKFFGIKLSGVKFEKPQFLSDSKLSKYLFLRSFAYFFYMTDGSLFIPAARKNFLIIQSPSHIPPLSIKNRLIINKWHLICYSTFIQSEIKKIWNLHATVLPPCIGVKSENKLKSKKNIILTVGRFFQTLHAKKQNILIDIFKKEYTRFSDWKLVIAGILSDDNGKQYLRQLKSKARHYPIEILVNIPLNTLSELYQSAKIYWHAAGFGENLKKFPGKAEHFGISILEAMSQGAVPIVFNAGGPKDFIEDSVNGFFWNSPNDLIKNTLKVIENDDLYMLLSKEAQNKALSFSCRFYADKIEKILT